MGTKKGRFYGKGVPFKGAPQTFRGAVAPNFPPGSATESMSGNRCDVRMASRIAPSGQGAMNANCYMILTVRIVANVASLIDIMVKQNVICRTK